MNATALHTEMLQLVTFKLAGRKYAVDIQKAQQINTMKEIITIPNAPPFLEGEIDLRGTVIPVVNLRRKFGIAEQSNELATVVLMDICGVIMGLVVDAVSDVLRIPCNVVEPPPVSLTVRTEFISGIAKLNEGLIVLLNMDKLLNDDEQETVFSDEQAA